MFVVALACVSKHLWRGNGSKGRAMFVLIVGLEKEIQSTTFLRECYLSKIHRETEATVN